MVRTAYNSEAFILLGKSIIRVLIDLMIQFIETYYRRKLD